jgi:hypothetical protein
VWNRLFKSFRDLLAIRWMKSRLLNYLVESEIGGERQVKPIIQVTCASDQSSRHTASTVAENL